MSVDVRRVDGEAALEDALDVRRRVFVHEQGVPENLEVDGEDDEATHFVAYVSPDTEGTMDEAVGAARLREYDDGTAKVERVAVLEPRRGEGIGRDLMAAVESHAAAADYDELVLDAQVPVLEFYRTLGYETTSDVFEDAGIPHREMRKWL